MNGDLLRSAYGQVVYGFEFFSNHVRDGSNPVTAKVYYLLPFRGLHFTDTEEVATSVWANLI